MKFQFMAMLALAAGAAGAQSASAADIVPARMPVKAPASVFLPNWSGVYVGVTAGGVWGRSKDTFNDPAVPALLGLQAAKADVSGFIGGGTLGANWQFSNIVLGVEGDGSWTNADGSSNLLPPFLTTTTLDVRERWIATARGRVGYAFDRWLVYVTGGGAWANVRYTATNAAGFTDTSSKTVSGWTVGGGVEAKLVGNWSAKAEYLYVDFGDNNFFTPVAAGGPSGSQVMNLTNHIARAGLNYSFAPVMLR
jgi:outer membrane immunogenic protein